MWTRGWLGERGSNHVDTGVTGGLGVSGDQIMWTREWLGVRSQNHLNNRPVVL